MSRLSQYFAQNQFCCLVEYLPTKNQVLPVRESLAGFPACMTLSDRVRSDEDIAPLIAAQAYPDHIEKVLHYAGKGRDIDDFKLFLKQAKQIQSDYEISCYLLVISLNNNMMGRGNMQEPAI